MGVLDDYPVQKVLPVLVRINDRCRMKDWSLVAEVTMMVSIEDARFLYAAMRWLEVLETMTDNLSPAKEKIQKCIGFLADKIENLKHQIGDEKWLGLNYEEVRLMRETERQVDQLVMMNEEKNRPKKRGKHK
jgi:hypothetical protein